MSISKKYLMGKYVIARGYYSGVFFGKVADVSDDMKVMVLEESVNLFKWESQKGTGNINSAINKHIKSARFEKTPGGIVILTENYSVFPCTDEQINVILENQKDFA